MKYPLPAGPEKQALPTSAFQLEITVGTPGALAEEPANRLGETDWIYEPETACRATAPAEKGQRRVDLWGPVQEVARAARLAGMPEEQVESFLLALWEALINALKHGNRWRPGSQIWVTYGLDGDRLWARVRDEGEGFDCSRVPDPRGEGKLLHVAGRGILMMRSVCDEIEWSQDGTEVRLLKLCPVGR